MRGSRLGCGRLARAAATLLLTITLACSPAPLGDDDPSWSLTADRRLETAWWERVSIEPAAERPVTDQERWVRVRVPASILFDLDSAELGIDGRATLERIIDDHGLRKARKVVVAGATDSSGTLDHNLDLSQRRAKAAVEVLIEAGLVGILIEIEAWADQRPLPVDDGVDQEAAAALQRRVEIHALLPATVIEEHDPQAVEADPTPPIPLRGALP